MQKSTGETCSGRGESTCKGPEVECAGCTEPGSPCVRIRVKRHTIVGNAVRDEEA